MDWAASAGEPGPFFPRLAGNGEGESPPEGSSAWLRSKRERMDPLVNPWVWKSLDWIGRGGTEMLWCLSLYVE